ncbi:4-hydroxyphenylpyruvate dioxygenase [Robbsia andropogonis]|uniref:4-hydroxyphenylpyruvate dioxygenase family protein n=1 Tax=Robbsia andropogonis TaxID=28092 RepID=UPI003D1DE2B2
MSPSPSEDPAFSSTTSTTTPLTTPDVQPDRPPVDPNNPLGMIGLEFVEFAAPDPQRLGAMFERLGLKPVARHVSKAVTLYRLGDIRFLVNGEPDSFAQRYASEYGVGVCALGVRVLSAKQAFKHALTMGAWPFEGERTGPHELKLRAIQGIGDSHIYFIDRWPGRPDDAYGTHAPSLYEVDFAPIDGADLTANAERAAGNAASTHLKRVDHFTQTVGAGRMDEWLGFYAELLHFHALQDLHPDGLAPTGARVVVSPCGGIRIPLYEEGAQPTETMHRFLPDHPGEGVQHIALASDDIVASVDALLARGMTFIAWPDAYYDQMDARLPGHGLDVAALRARQILVDGHIDPDGTPRLFLQAFLRHAPGEIFFEIVERRGHPGFGEGNLAALQRSQAPSST